MKKNLSLLLAVSVIIWSCNNASKESTNSTDTTNTSSNNMSSDSGAGGGRMTDTVTRGNGMPTDEASKSFLPKAADGGITEVQQGQLAQQKGMSQAVKDFGIMMVHDHSDANGKVLALARQRNITLPTTPGEKNQKMIDELAKKSGRDFDKAYINGMVKDHHEDIKEFEEASKKVTDTDVKSFIDNTLPVLRVHLDSAKAIQKRLK